MGGEKACMGYHQQNGARDISVVSEKEKTEHSLHAGSKQETLL